MFRLRSNRWSSRQAARRLSESTNGHRRPLADRHLLVKLAIALASAVAAVAVIAVGGPPFPYRLGQTVTRDITAKIRFEQVNETRTARRRDQAAEAVPPIYANDPRPIEELRGNVESLLDVIAPAKTFDDVPGAVATEWGLTAETFAVLQPALDTAQEHQDFRQAVRSSFQRLLGHGVLDLDPNDPPPELRGVARVQVRAPATPQSETYELAEVSRQSLLEANGPLARALDSHLQSKAVAEAIFQLVVPRLRQLPATLTFDHPATQAAREFARNSVPPEKETYNPGMRLVSQNQVIGEDQLALLRAEHKQFLAAGRTPWDKFRRATSLTVLVFALYALAGSYISRFEKRLADDLARLALLGVVVVAALGIARLVRGDGDFLHGETIPVALAAMTLALVYNQQLALLLTFSLGLMCSWMFGTGVGDFVVLTGGTAAAVLSLGRVRSRTKLIAVGALAGATYFALTWGTGLLGSQAIELVFYDSLQRLMWGSLCGFLMGGSLPYLEKLLGVVTDINLLELSDLSHPLLMELMRKAPGTYNHSIAVATLAEGAAEKIGANSLLVRVGSYFHDVGKMLKPHYFVENQTDAVDRHEALNPAMSTLIIIGHVKDGADLAHQHGLPQPIIDLIEQHHGTTLVEYFYNEAAREVRENRETELDVEESAFRYPGPKPQTREACVVMLADAVESASRTLSEPNPGRIEGLVHELTQKRLHDGQFDECGITLQEISAIKESLIKSLNAIYHGRVKYPEQQTA